MEYKDKVLEYYRTGRYQCDYQIHLHLQEIVKQLNLYEWLPFLEGQIQQLKKIKEITEINANCLDEDYDDEQGLCQTYKIRSMINQLDLKGTPKIIDECQSLNWESYESKVNRFLAGKPEYQAITQRIQSTIHSDQFRISSLLFTAFFDYVNGAQLNECINIYRETMEYYLQYLTNQRTKFHFLIESEEYSNIAQTQKVKVYVGSLFFVVKLCLRFCEILKTLTGKSNLALKFTVVKKEIEKLMKQYPEWKFQQQKEDLFKILPLFKLHIKNMQSVDRMKICRWCFKELKNEQIQHSFCNVFIKKKQLFK